jgi:histidine ammonia-lyase
MMALVLFLGDGPLTLAQIAAVATGQQPTEFSPASVVRMQTSRRAVAELLASGQVAYGVNTGFGRLSDHVIPPEQLQTLQRNLVRSHACGIGNPLSPEETRALLLLRANALGLGFSGARAGVAQLVNELLVRDVLPIIPEKGSVGASGDLAPLAHLALVLIGEGQALYHAEVLPGGEALKLAQLVPIELQAKEGLALLNGTQAINAVGALALWRAFRVSRAASIAGAMSLEALLGTPVAFDERIHLARPHSTQLRTAQRLRHLLRKSEIRESHLVGDPRVQDAYSLRCMPQVHGAVEHALEHARSVLEIESGSATDNPLVFCDGETEILSGGNFHAAPLGLVLDYAAIALTDLGSVSERRIDRLINPDLNESLPAFLTPHPGVSSGFMIAHVAAVSLLSECKVLSHPSSVDNLPTSGGKEDHVSMGMTAALKFRSIVTNMENVIAVELLCAAQGIEFRRPLRAGEGVEQAHSIVREMVPKLGEDRALAPDIAAIAAAIRVGRFDTVS